MDKIILQDMLAERAKLRDAIPDSVKYADVALAGVIAFVLNAKYEAPQLRSAEQTVWRDTKIEIMLVFVLLLLVGFVFKVDEMTMRLRMLNKTINQKLTPWSVRIEDKSIIAYGRYIIFTLVITALTTYLCWQYSKQPATVMSSRP